MPHFADNNFNDEGYNTRTGTVHCCASDAEGHATCVKPLFDRYRTFNDHVFTVWEHFGKDKDGPMKIPRQTSIMYCLDHSPFNDKEATRACIKCGKDVDRDDARSEVDVTAVKLAPGSPLAGTISPAGTTPSSNPSQGPKSKAGHYRLHDSCLLPEFHVVKSEQERISAAPPPPAPAKAEYNPPGDMPKAEAARPTADVAFPAGNLPSAEPKPTKK